VYIAPPQYKEMWSKALTLLDANPGWLSDESWVVAQIHPREMEELELHHLEKFDERKYGSTLLIFYEKK
jgi:16S rRNA (guanine966-N2)-methyltransferase